MIRNAFWFSTGVASTFAAAVTMVKYINKNHPKFADETFADARKL